MSNCKAVYTFKAEYTDKDFYNDIELSFNSREDIELREMLNMCQAFLAAMQFTGIESLTAHVPRKEELLNKLEKKSEQDK